MNQAFNKVLVVTDFSGTANRAIPYAYAVAIPNAEVHLVHIVEHVENPSPLYAHYTPDDLATPEKRAKFTEECEAHLRTLIPEDSSGIATVCGVGYHKDIAPGIVAEAKTRGADVIVIGSHGRTGVAHLLMGSVAESVLRESSIPVLVVPHGD